MWSQPPESRRHFYNFASLDHGVGICNPVVCFAHRTPQFYGWNIICEAGRAKFPPLKIIMCSSGCIKCDSLPPWWLFHHARTHPLRRKLALLKTAHVNSFSAHVEFFLTLCQNYQLSLHQTHSFLNLLIWTSKEQLEGIDFHWISIAVELTCHLTLHWPLSALLQSITVTTNSGGPDWTTAGWGPEILGSKTYRVLSEPAEKRTALYRGTSVL